jgi:hypothetical protein
MPTKTNSENIKDIGKMSIDVAVILNKVDFIRDELAEIKECLEHSVKDDDSYREIKRKVNFLWDERNKMIGWMIGAGATGGAIASVFKGVVTDIFAKW